MSDKDPYQIKTDSPAADDLMFWSIVGHEAFSRPSAYELTVLSKNLAIEPNDILGHAFDVVIEFTDADGNPHERHCQGHAVRFERMGTLGRYAEYRFVLRSWFWLLSKRVNSRIEQDQTTLEVIETVFADEPITRIKKTNIEGAIGKYEPRRYCVQYQERDDQFVSRLLEEDGIYYWFDAHEDPDTMRFGDASDSVHQPLPVAATLQYIQQGQSDARYQQIVRWTAACQLHSGKYASRDVNYKTINKVLSSEGDVSAAHELSDLECFEHPGGYFTKDRADALLTARNEELETRTELHWALTHWPDVGVGRGFTLEGEVSGLYDGDYLIAACTFVITHPGYEGFSSNDARLRPVGEVLRDFIANDCVNVQRLDAFRQLIDETPDLRTGLRGNRSFLITALPAKAHFRPPRLTPRVTMPGPQSAIVVGPEGEELHVDEMGRVKVHFHWDRKDLRNEKSTCWIRVSQPWAGKSWGGYFIPRIGQEVIVDFMNGDPDRPIIVGRVYNDDQKIPYESPTQSGFKTRSTPKGNDKNYNEIMFEDKKGSELLRVHAERNQQITVEVDETHSVGNDRAKTIGHDETNHIKNDRKETVDNNETIDIGANRTETVGADEKISIGANRTEDVGANEKISIGANRTEDVAANEDVTIGANRTLNVGASETVNVGASRTEKIGASLTQTTAGAVTLSSGGPMTLDAKGGLNIIAPGGTKVVDFQFLQFGGDEKVGYATSLNFSLINTEINAVKGEFTAFTNAAIPVKFEKVGVENKEAAAGIKAIAAEIASGAAAIASKAIHIFK